MNLNNLTAEIIQSRGDGSQETSLEGKLKKHVTGEMAGNRTIYSRVVTGVANAKLLELPCTEQQRVQNVVTVVVLHKCFAGDPGLMKSHLEHSEFFRIDRDPGMTFSWATDSIETHYSFFIEMSRCWSAADIDTLDTVQYVNHPDTKTQITYRLSHKKRL